MKTLFTKNRKQDILLSILLMFCIISFAVIVTVFCKQLYYFDIDYLSIPAYSGISKDIIKKNYDILIQYQSIFYQGTLNMPDFVMSTTGRIHFEEVKKVFEFIQVLFVVTLLPSLYMIYQNIKQKEYRFLKLTSMITVLVPTILGLLVSIDFDQAFVLFHQIVFRNDYWIFDEVTDPVITILPESFFMHCFMMIVIIIIGISIVLYAIYKYKEKQILSEEGI